MRFSTAMTKVKSNPSKTNKDNQLELIDLDLVKSEPEEIAPLPAATTSVAKIQGDNASQEFTGNPIVIAPQVSTRVITKTVPVALNVPAGTALQQGNYAATGGGHPSKTFLLINNRSGVQSMLIGGNAVSRKPFSGVIESSQLPQIRVRTSMGMQTIVSNTGPKTSSLVVAQKQGESGIMSAGTNKITAEAAAGATKVCTNASEFQPRPISTLKDIVFTSRSIDADGTVKTTKEYLCNFCQFKVSVQADFEAHKNTHTFSCSHCSFKALSRFDVLKHKKERHPNCSEELAGYQDLDKLIDSINAAAAVQTMTSTCPLSASNVPFQMSVELPRAPSPDPPQLELQSVSTSMVVATIDKGPASTATANSVLRALMEPSCPDEKLSRRSDSIDSAKSSTQNSGRVTADSAPDAPNIEDSISRMRPSRPRRAVTEKKQTLREIDSDSQGEFEANQSDDDDWEEKLPKSSGRKKPRRDGGKYANLGKSPEDLSVTPQSLHDHSLEMTKKSTPTKYRCITCSFETTDSTVLSNHLKIHENPTSQKIATVVTNSGTNQNKIMRDPNHVHPTSADVAPSVSINWSCFYCNLLSDSQATIVGHVVKAHPGRAIQVKRISLPSSSAGIIQRLGPSTSVGHPQDILSTSTSAQDSSSRGIAPAPISVQMSQLNKSANMAKTKVSNPENEGCLWGCYYCQVQSIERSEVIAHLKRDHPDVKLIVTRRRITHIPATLKPVKMVGKDGEGSKKSGEIVDSTSSMSMSKSLQAPSNNESDDKGAEVIVPEKEEEARGRSSKRKIVGGKKKKSLVNISTEPRVLRSSKVSPGSTSPSHREGSPSHASVNSSEGMGPPSKKRKVKPEDQDKNSHSSFSTSNNDCGDNDCKGAADENSDRPKINQGIVRKIQDYPKSAAIKSLAEEIRWKCSYCEFKVVHRSKVIYHVVSNHPEKPVKFYRLSQGKILDLADMSCSKLRGPRSMREMNLLKNGNWLWQCPLCERKHVSKGYLNVHLKVAHPKQFVKGSNLVPIRKCKPLNVENPKAKNCSVSLVRAEDMVHYDSLCTILLDNGLSLIKALDVDEDLECDVVRHRKYKCGKCNMRGFRPMIVKLHFLESHSATEVLVIDLKRSLGNSARGDRCLVYSCLKKDCNIFTSNKSELESHYNDYPEHARGGRPSLCGRREFNDSIPCSDGNDSEITDQGIERSESRPLPFEYMDCTDPPAKDAGLSTGDDIGRQDCPVSLKISADVAEQLASTSSSVIISSSEGGEKNSMRALFLTPKNSNIVSGLSLLKKTLNTTQVMSDMKKLNKSNGSEEQQTSPVHSRS